MQDLNPLFIVKLGGIPQPILAAMALMAEAHHIEATESGESSSGDFVDFERMVKEDPYRLRSATEN
ncbi:MAG: hypothetical protein JO025_01720 [Verrucomicrobia bacterium]|nr:hypothetical protein [Verrucomicrobiota bacterium]